MSHCLVTSLINIQLERKGLREATKDQLHMIWCEGGGKIATSDILRRDVISNSFCLLCLTISLEEAELVTMTACFTITFIEDK